MSLQPIFWIFLGLVLLFEIYMYVIFLSKSFVDLET